MLLPLGAVERGDHSPLDREVREPPEVVHALASADRVVAVEHHLLVVRVGELLFGERPPRESGVLGSERSNHSISLTEPF